MQWRGGETKISNCDITRHAIWPLAETRLSRDRPVALTAIHSPSGLKFLPLEEANVTVDCLKNQFTPHDLWGERWTAGGGPSPSSVSSRGRQFPKNVRPCDVQKLMKFLRLRRACGTDGIPNECLRNFPRMPLVHLANILNHFFWLSQFPSSWKDQSHLRTRSSPKVYDR
jgi:hypothetical protein